MTELRNKNYPGVGLDDLWPWSPYKRSATVQWVIENDLPYVKRCVEKFAFNMNNEAFEYYASMLEEDGLDD